MAFIIVPGQSSTIILNDLQEFLSGCYADGWVGTTEIYGYIEQGLSDTAIPGSNGI